MQPTGIGAAVTQEATALAATGGSRLVAGNPVHPLRLGTEWGSGRTGLNAALDKGAGTPETWTLQPTVAGQDHGTVGPSMVHEAVRANKLILSLLALGSLVSFVSSSDGWQ